MNTNTASCIGEGLFLPVNSDETGTCHDCGRNIGGRVVDGQWIVLAAHLAR